jgi:hypothetical protein
MFGRRKKNKLDEDSGDGSGNTIEIGQKSPSQEVEESSGFGIYFILAIAFLVLLSLVFLFYSVIPSIGWLIYQKTTEYLWKPMSWMPLWVGLLIILLIYLFGDFLKPVVYYKDQRAFYTRIYERNGLKHIKRLWRGEIIVSSQRVKGWGAMRVVTHRNLNVNTSGKNILLEGSDQLEVSHTVDIEAELKVKDERIAKLRRQLVAAEARSNYYDLEMARIRSGGQRKNE